MKITMVGISGSGKTTFMSGLYEVLGSNAVKGFRIEPSAETMADALIAQGSFNEISFQANQNMFPVGTQKTTVWSFDLTYKARNLVYNFEWIDYRGGILTDIYDAHNDSDKLREVEALLGHIISSSAVMLFADSVSLTYYAPHVARRQSGADIICQLFNYYKRYYPDRPLTFLIALTKADMVEAKYKQNGYTPLIQRGLEVFGDMVDLCIDNPNWEGGIVPVSSVGEGKAKNTITRPSNPLKDPLITQSEIIDFPEPLNIEHALFYCIGSTLMRLEIAALAGIRAYEQEIREALERSSIFTDFMRKVMGKTTTNDIVQALKAQQEQEKRTLQQFKPYIDPLYLLARHQVYKIRRGA